jgi:hypothetical protein
MRGTRRSRREQEIRRGSERMGRRGFGMVREIRIAIGRKRKEIGKLGKE